MILGQKGGREEVLSLCRRHYAIWATQRGATLSEDSLDNWGPSGWVVSAIREAYLLGMQKGKESKNETN